MERVADKEELLLLLDDCGNSTNKLEKRSVVHSKGLWHREIGFIPIKIAKNRSYYKEEVKTKNPTLIVGLYVLVMLLGNRQHYRPLLWKPMKN